MCGCDCCNSGNPTCFDPSKVDSWASSKAWVCGCTCGNCLSRVIDGAFREGQRLGKQMGMDAAREAVDALENAGGYPSSDFDHIKDDALAVIDALREGDK